MQRLDRPNIRLCLDTFQAGGGEWGDPITKSEKIERMNSEEPGHKFKNSSGIVDCQGAAGEDLTGQ